MSNGKSNGRAKPEGFTRDPNALLLLLLASTFWTMTEAAGWEYPPPVLPRMVVVLLVPKAGRWGCPAPVVSSRFTDGSILGNE